MFSFFLMVLIMLRNTHNTKYILYNIYVIKTIIVVYLPSLSLNKI